MKISNKLYDEVWLPIGGYEGLYEVSNRGRVKSLDRWADNRGKMQFRPERVLSPRRNKLGYESVSLCKEGDVNVCLVHRLVAEAFLPNPEGKPFVDHLDTDPSNNDVANLRWCTQKENCNNPKSKRNNSLGKMGHPQYCPSEVLRENIKKAHEANRGKPLSEERKRALSEVHKSSERAQKASRENVRKAYQHNKGKTRSDEVRRKISEGHKGIFKGKTWKVVDGKRVWLDAKEEQAIC